MASEQTQDPASVDQLRSTVQKLELVIREMEGKRQRQIRQRRRQLLLIGTALSLLAHISIMIVLTAIHRPSRGGGESQAASYEFAIVQEEQLTELPETQFADLIPESIDDLDDLQSDTDAVELSAESPTLELTNSGSLPTLGGAGGGGEGLQGLAGGAAGTSFFGITSTGTRFAYVVDISGSMRQGRKMPTAMRELGRSISALPDYAHFYVVLFQSNFLLPPMQRGWRRARPATVRSLVRWLDNQAAGGGTQPQPALAQVFGLDVRPDVVFFLTDGEIPRDTPQVVAALNDRRRPVVVNTIAFGDPSSQELLKQIAQESNGVYRYVPSD